MKPLVRWKDLGDEAPVGAKLFVRHGERPRAILPDECARTETLVRALPMSMPARWWSIRRALLGGIPLALALGVANVTGLLHGSQTAAASSVESNGSSSVAAPSVAATVTDDMPGVPVASLPDSPPEAHPRQFKAARATSPSPQLRVPEPSPDATDDPLTRELAALEASRRALASDPAKVLAELEEQGVVYRDGQLGAEREILAVRALVQMRRADEARRRGEAFLSRASNSPYRERMGSILAAIAR